MVAPRMPDQRCGRGRGRGAGRACGAGRERGAGRCRENNRPIPIAMIAPARPTARIAIAGPGPTPSEPVVVNAGAIEPSGDELAVAATGPTADGSAAPAVVAGLAVANSAVEADGPGDDDALDVADADATGLAAGALEAEVVGIGWIET